MDPTSRGFFNPWISQQGAWTSNVRPNLTGTESADEVKDTQIDSQPPVTAAPNQTVEVSAEESDNDESFEEIDEILRKKLFDFECHLSVLNQQQKLIRKRLQPLCDSNGRAILLSNSSSILEELTKILEEVTKIEKEIDKL